MMGNIFYWVVVFQNCESLLQYSTGGGGGGPGDRGGRCDDTVLCVSCVVLIIALFVKLGNGLALPLLS